MSQSILIVHCYYFLISFLFSCTHIRIFSLNILFLLLIIKFCENNLSEQHLESRCIKSCLIKFLFQFVARGFNDPNLFCAETTQPRVAPITLDRCTTRRVRLHPYKSSSFFLNFKSRYNFYSFDSLRN